MRKLHLVSIIAVIATSFLLAGCEWFGSDAKAPAPIVKVPTPTLTAEQQAMKAKADIQHVAKQVARAGDFKHPSACNSTPVELAASEAYNDFPLTGPSIYKDACRGEILAMKAEAKQAVADAKATEAKRLAKLKAKPVNGKKQT